MDLFVSLCHTPLFVRMVSRPLAPRALDELIGFGYPYLPAILSLRLQYRRFSKKLGVLNVDIVYP
jgi:hypothetical protein